ncbi:MAG: ubiquitin-activating E1 FCCH domain-containing protein, partial [Acidimicrobiales bacterium]
AVVVSTVVLVPTVIAVSAPVAPAAAVAGMDVGDIGSVDLALLGSSNLAVRGLDGQVKPRGNNGDLAVLKNTAYVGGGAVFHGAQGSPGRVCTDWGGVKVVDLTNSAAPTVRTTITLVDNAGVVTGPIGNPRRNVKADNVSVSASALDARSVVTPSFTGDVLAVATQRCEQPFTTDGRIEFYDVTNPTAPARLGTYATAAEPNGWGIYEDVRMFTRNNGPGGSARLYALATLPFNGNDMRLIDITDLRNPVEVGAFPAGADRIDTTSVNVCKPYVAARSAAPSPDGSRAIVSLFDGTTSFGPNPASVVNLDLDNLPAAVAGSNPTQFTPIPPSFTYPPNPLVEGNAADVQPFLDASGGFKSFVSEDDIDPAVSNLTVTGPGFTGFDGRVCEILVGRKIYEYPNQQLRAPIVYVGLACGPQTLAGSTTLVAEPPLVDPRGAIALADPGSGCTAQERLEYLQSLGALGVMQGNPGLDTFISGPEGGYPSAPNLVVPTAAASAIQYAPNVVLGGNTFPTTFTRTTTADSVTATAAAAAQATMLAVQATTTALPIGTNLVFPGNVFKIVSVAVPTGSTSVSVLAGAGAVASGAVGAVTNVTVRPRAVAVTAAANATPIALTTAAHGLATGDRVAIAEVAGTTAANGTWTVTVTSPTTFTLDGSVGNGVYTGSGYVAFCLPGSPNCTAAPTRTDRSRYQSVAGPADRVAGGQMAAASRFDVVAGRSYIAGATLELQRVTGGAFRANAVWYDAGGAVINTGEITSLSAVTPITRFNRTLVAPAGAVKGGLAFEWTGATADGLAYAQLLSFGPSGLEAQLVDNRGEWGAQRIIDFSAATPTEVATYRSPGSRAWPPPNNGIYAPRQARLVGKDLAFATWMSDGLRVLDVSDPRSPREVGSFVPPDVADPSVSAGAGPTNQRGQTGNLQRGQSWPNRALVTGVDTIARTDTTGLVVVSDINAGLYVLSY